MLRVDFRFCRVWDESVAFVLPTLPARVIWPNAYAHLWFETDIIDHLMVVVFLCEEKYQLNLFDRPIILDLVWFSSEKLCENNLEWF